jgi:hypothetical protein
MSRSPGVVERALLDKGMERDENHHHMFRKTIDGVTHLVTRTSHNAQEINDHLAMLMGKQLCLQQREFWNLVECTLSEDDWIAIVRERCRDGRNPFLSR